MKEKFEVNKILIPIDFSKTSKVALDHAANLCSKFKSELYLLHVFTSSNIEVFPNLDMARNFDNVKNAVSKEIESIANEFREKYGVKVNAEIKDGSISKEIVNTAEEVEADMIVMGTHGVSGFEEFFLGSNAYRVVTSSTVPVFTIQEGSKKTGYERILLPIDNSQHSRDKVAEAAYFAKAFGAKIFIAALVDEEGEEDKNKLNLKIKQVEDYLYNNDVDFDRTFLHGDDVADMTMEYAEKIEADLIFIMTEQEAATGLFVGPYAQRIVNHCKVPVISVTPLGILSDTQNQLKASFRPFRE
ncbi:MAG: universal stress protein [Vicingaceae bacterium]